MRKLLGFLLMLLPITVFAQSAIDGTWRVDRSKTQFDPKPVVIVLKDGTYSCVSCDPKITVKADGSDQKVTGYPYADTEKVTVVNPNTVEVDGMKEGKVSFRATMEVSADGKTLKRTFEEHLNANGEVTTSTYMLSRVGDPEPGAHALSGQWKVEKSTSETPMTFTWAMKGDSLMFKGNDGSGYNAKFDGKDYPYMGDPGTTSVVLKKIDDKTFEETDKLNGEVVWVTQYSISPDGKTLTLVSNNKHSGRTSTWVAEKQEMQEAEK